MSETPTIVYRFRLPDGTEREFSVEVGADSISHSEFVDDAPEWTELDHKKCPHCPLPSTEGARCPAALSIWEFVEAFEGLPSFETVDLTVVTQERTIVCEGASLQTALRSLMGLVLPTSGCPHMDMFRPMARFHLPLATIEETVYRAASMYLLGEWLEESKGGSADYDLNGLAELYGNVKVVNKHLVTRFVRETEGDASVNAVVLLDVLAQMLPIAVRKSLQQIRPYFDAYRHPED